MLDNLVSRRWRGRGTFVLFFGLAIGSGTALADATLPGECAFPEGITSTTDGSLYVGSMQYGAIYKISAGSTEGEIFVPENANGLVSTLGVFADEERGRLIACSADPGIAHTQVGDDRFTGKAGSGIRVFDLETGAALDAVDFPGSGFCNDIAVDGAGNIYATDTFHGRVLKYDGTGISVWAMGGALASQPWTLNGIDYSADEDALYVGNQSTGQLFRLGIEDDGSPMIREVALNRRLDVPDGLRFIDADTIAVIEAGTGSYSTINLNDGTVSVVAEGLASPATFAAARGKAWVTSAQGGEFWTAEGSCEAADKPFRIIETSLR